MNSMLLPLVLTVLFSQGCSEAPPPGRIIKGADEVQKLEAELRNKELDLSRIAVVRMQVGEQAFEVTSISPLRFQPSKGIPVLSMVRINKEKDGLIVFTRNGDSANLYEAPFTALQGGTVFKFPIAAKGGVVESKTVTINEVLVR